jgi:hypothetical protein
MERRALVGMVLLAAIGAGLGAVGCGVERHEENPYISEQGKAITMGDTPLAVQKFVETSYPDAQVENVYEMRHRKNYRMRHFEIHLVMADGRKKTVDYNVFGKASSGVQTLESTELSGAGTSPKAQIRGEMQGQR